MARAPYSVHWWLRSRGFTVSLNTYEPGLEVGVHRHACDQLCVLLAGRYETSLDGDAVRCAEGGSVFQPAGADHTDRIADARCSSLRIEWSAQRRPIGRAMGASVLECATIAGLARRLADTTPRLGRDRELANELMLAIDEALSANERDSAMAPPWFDRAHAFVLERYREPIGLRDVAEVAGRGRSQVAGAFRAYLGTSVGELVHQLRVEAAEEAMLDPGARLIDVATEAGFADQPHMNRVFLRARGLSPARWRRLGAT